MSETITIEGYTFTVPAKTTSTVWIVEFTQPMSTFCAVQRTLVLNEAHQEAAVITEGFLKVKWHNATVTMVPLSMVVAITSYEATEAFIDLPSHMTRLPR